MLRLSSMFRLRGPIGILSLALLLSLTACGRPAKTRGPAAQSPEGETWVASNGNSPTPTNVTNVSSSGNVTNQSIRPGMSYEAVVAQLGQPREWRGAYSWNTLSGQYLVEFNERNEAISYNIQGENAANANPEIAEQIRNRASLNSISGLLGGSPTFIGGEGEWQPPGATMMSQIRFSAGGVSSYQEFPAYNEPTSRNPNPY